MHGTGERWSIVLAGGDGTRCRDYFRHRYPDGRPKQFCSVCSEKTLVEETLERARLFSGTKRTVLSVCRKHLRWRHTWENGASLSDGLNVTVQPRNLDTGPALAVANLLIHWSSPNAIVAVFPSDHYFSDPLRFVSLVREAAGWVEQNSDSIAIIGVEATRPETEYGWLLPRKDGRFDAGRPTPIHFFEKPTPVVANRLFQRGALWNTSVFVFRTRLMLRLLEVFAPRWSGALDDTFSDGEDVLDRLYATLPSFNLSSDLLQHSTKHVWAWPLHNVEWCDLGNDERLRAHQRQTRPLGGRVAEGRFSRSSGGATPVLNSAL